MDCSEVLDINALIVPISEDSPVGADPREDVSPTSRYFTLKDYRNQARANERAALVDEELASSIANDWRPIVEQVPEALINESKDLEYAAWLIEALCRIDGFAGLATGFKVARQLIESFWDDLYPLPDEDGLETRIAPLIGLNGYDGEGSLITPILSIPITSDNGSEAFATWQFNRASEIAMMDEDKQRQKAESGITALSDIEDAVKASPVSFYIELMAQLETSMSEFQLLSNAMDAAMGGEPQPTSMIAKSLDKCQEAIRYLAGEMIDQAQSDAMDAAESDVEDNNQESDISAQPQRPKKLEDREHAISMLKEVSEFFRKTEPHSPMPYAIDQVIRWSGLELPELLQELIDDGGARNNYFRLTGIPVGD